MYSPFGYIPRNVPKYIAKRVRYWGGGTRDNEVYLKGYRLISDVVDDGDDPHVVHAGSVKDTIQLIRENTEPCDCEFCESNIPTPFIINSNQIGDTVYNVGIEIGSKNHFDVIGMFDASKVAPPYYLLYVVYTTGDSFGSYPGEVEFVAIFVDKELAEWNAKNIRRDYEVNGDLSVNIYLENNITFRMSAPWKGYFERIDDIVVETVTYGGKKTF